jgi:vacuolar-type H+-ATPase subunit E/Vma4
MSLDELLARLGRDADAQAGAVVATARGEADRIRREAETACDAERSARLGAQEAVLRTEARAEVERARREATRAVLGERRAVLDRVLSRAGELLPAAVATPAYLASVGAELDRALEIVGGGGAVLRAAPAIAARIAGRNLPAIEVRADPGIAGFRLEGADGRVAVDATLPARLQRLAPELTIAAARALEEDP